MNHNSPHVHHSNDGCMVLCVLYVFLPSSSSSGEQIVCVYYFETFSILKKTKVENTENKSTLLYAWQLDDVAYVLFEAVVSVGFYQNECNLIFLFLFAMIYFRCFTSLCRTI